MKNYQKLFVLGAVLLASFSFFNSAKSATLNQTSVSLSVGQSYTIYATNVISSLYLTSNSVPSVASVSISGNNINIYGSTTGSTNAVVCDSSSICSTIYITVGGGGSYSGTLSLSQTNISTTVGQTTTVTAYNTYGTSSVLYISNNSNSSVATATVSGNIVTIYGSSTGSSTISVCQSYNISCGTIYVTVSGYGYNNYTNTTTGLNISNLTLPVGGSATLSSSNNYSYNGTSLYVSSNSNPNIVSTGSGSGTTGCTAGALYSVVTGQPCNSSIYSSNNNYAYIPGCYAGSIYSVTTGQLCSSSNGYGYSGTTNGTGSITISAITPGSDTLTICQSGGLNSCNTIYVTVTGSVYAVPLSSSPTYNSSGIPTVYSTTNAY